VADPIHVAFRYTEEQYAAGVRLHLAKRFRWRIDAPIAAGVVVLGVVALAAGWGIVGPIAMSAGALYLCILALGWFWLPVRQYRAQPKLHDEYRLTFSEEGIAFETEHVASTLAWSTYQRAVADATTYLLYYGEDAFTVLPRAAFRGPDDEARFGELVERKIPRLEKI
jgi:hypothetical protein